MQFKNLRELILYTEQLKRFEDGEIVSVGEKKYKYNKSLNDWDLVTNINPSISLYELNQQIISTYPVHDDKQIQKDIEIIDTWYQNDEDQNLNYIMLNNELRYYTILSYDWGYGEYDRFGEAVIKTIQSLGDIVDIEVVTDAIELWIKKDSEVYVVYLFGYDKGTVTFR